MTQWPMAGQVPPWLLTFTLNQKQKRNFVNQRKWLSPEESISFLQTKLDSEVLHFWEQVDKWLDGNPFNKCNRLQKRMVVLLILLSDYFQMLLHRFAALLNYSCILACLFVLSKKSKQEDLHTEFIAQYRFRIRHVSSYLIR